MSTEYLLGGSPTAGVNPVTSFSADDGWHTQTRFETVPTRRPSSSSVAGDSKTIYLVVSSCGWTCVRLAVSRCNCPRTGPHRVAAAWQHPSPPALPRSAVHVDRAPCIDR